MKKNLLFKHGTLFTIMRVTFCQLVLVALVSAMCYAHTTPAQELLNREITLKARKTPLKEVLTQIEKGAGVQFAYCSDCIDLSEQVSIDVKKERLSVVLNKLFIPLDMDYRVVNSQILLSKIKQEGSLEEDSPAERQVESADRSIRGKVTDSNGGTLPGVTVLVKGSSIGTTTDAAGVYTLSVSDAARVLVFSYVGMASKEVVIANQSVIDIVLENSVNTLEDVVVTALGISREKSSLGYSIGEITAEKLQKVPQENVLNALTGKVAGLRISNSNSDLNAETQIVIRGRKSLTGKDAPLIVIDGLPVGDDASVVSDLNANNIASVSVLKGPSAAALYGSRAGNGVLLITTKSGDGGKKGIGVTFNSGYTASIPYHFVQQQHRFTNGTNGELNEGLATHWYGPEEGTSLVHYGSNGVAAPLKFYPKNQQKFFQTGNSYINDISIQGSANRASFRLSLSDMRGTGTFPGTELKKNAFDLSATYDITSKVKVSANVHILNTGSDNFSVQSHDDYQYEEIFFVPNHINVEGLKDYWDVKDSKQKVWAAGYNNPYFAAHEILDQFQRVRAYGNAKLDWQLTSDLSLMLRLGNSKNNLKRTNRIPLSEKRNANGVYRYSMDYSEETNADFLLAYKKELGDFSVNISAGGNSLFLKGTGSGMGGNRLTLPGLYTAGNVDRASLSYSSYLSNKRINSLYGMASLGYKDYVYLDITGRNDWSSTLPKANRSYFYPSASLSLVLSRMFELPQDISLLKLRGGWAAVGKDTDPYQLSQVLARSTWGANVAYSLGATMPNKNLKPERAVSTEAGFDMSFFQKRLGLNFTYYEISNRDQILNVNIPAMTGYTAAQINAGIVRNRGIELELNVVPIQGKDFTWDMNFVFTKDRSKLVKLTEGIDTFQFWESTQVYNRTKVGENIGDMYGYDVLRVTDETSPYYMWPLLDANGKAQRDTELKKIGNVISDFMLGFQTNVTYKNFTLAANFDWRQGGQYYSMTMLRLARGGMLEDWHNGIHSSTFTGILGSNSFGGNVDQIAQELKDHPEIYRDNLVWVGGRTQELGGFPIDGRHNGAYFPGVRSNGAGGYVENFGQAGTKFFSSNNIIDPGGGWWSQGTQMWMYDASYLKMRELSLAYSFPHAIAGKIKAQALSLSVFAKNFILWTKAKNDIDPELAYLNTGGSAISAGFDRWNSGPWTASVGLKLNVQF